MTSPSTCYNEEVNCNREAVVTCQECDGEFCNQCYNDTHKNGVCKFK